MIKLVLAITGASGSIYAKVMIDKLIDLKKEINDISLIFSDNAKNVWKHELGNNDFEKIPFKIYEKNDFNAPFASGSANYNAMIIVPCSMGTLSRIANGISNDLITRAADVILKERRKLILITRETPLNLIHIENMKKITQCGGIIMPACPSFYSKTNNFYKLASTVVDRALDLIGIKINTYRWKS